MMIARLQPSVDFEIILIRVRQVDFIHIAWLIPKADEPEPGDPGEVRRATGTLAPPDIIQIRTELPRTRGGRSCAGSCARAALLDVARFQICFGLIMIKTLGAGASTTHSAKRQAQ
jgi:hypothetical protein